MTALLAICFLAGSLTSNAQTTAEPVVLEPELQTLADEVLNLSLEDPDKANRQMMKLLRKCKKDAGKVYQVGRYFIEKNNFQCAQHCAKEAYNLNAKDMKILFFKGEVAEMAKNWGLAGQAYEEILLIDPTNIEAMKKIADNYKYVNPEMAKEYLYKVKEIDPADTYTDKTLGHIFYREENMKGAVKFYEAYYKALTAENAEIFHGGNYANALFLTQKYDKAINVCKALEKRDNANKTFKAVKFWSLVEKLKGEITDMQLGTVSETEQMYRMLGTDADAAMAYMTNKEYADSAYGYWDYYYAAQLNAGKGNHEEAINLQKLAVEKDTARVAGYQVMSELLQGGKRYEEALPYYQTYLKKMKEINRAQATDTFKLGYLYFTLAQVDSVKREQWMKDGDAIFQHVSESAPDSYMGPIFRARLANVGAEGTEIRDNVRAFYVEALKRIGDNARAKNDKLECLQYLAVCDIQKDEYAEALTYIQQMEAVDPNNGWVKSVKPFVLSQLPADAAAAAETPATN